jgi:iron complex outermembrane recepter protein
MKFGMKQLPRSLCLAGLSSLAILPVWAQTNPPATAAPERKPEKIEVTGTNIKRVDAETASPVTIITREDIERQGVSSVAELLRNLPNSTQVGGVVSDLTGNNSFSGAASSANLRGLGAAATLVLLNGRRLAPFSLANPNGGVGTLVNVDSLPLNVIERVEVLRDGASAIYGSDAVAGVINFITRADFKGALVTGSVEQNRESEYHGRRATLTFGHGDLASRGFNVFGNIEVRDRAETRFRDVEPHVSWEPRNRSVFNVGNPTSTYPGNYFRVLSTSPVTGLVTASQFVGRVPGCENSPDTFVDAAGRCIYDQFKGNVVAPELKRFSSFFRATADVSANLSLFAEFSHNRNEASFTNNPNVYGDAAFVPYFRASDGGSAVPPELILPVGHPNNPYGFPVTLRLRFHELGPTQVITEDVATRAVAGARFGWKTWDVEAALNDSRNTADLIRTKNFSLTAMRDAIVNGGYNFLSPNSGRLKPNDLVFDTTDEGKSTNTGVDVKASTELMKLSGGPLGLAIGAEFRSEKYSTTPDARIVAGEAIGNGASSASGSRRVSSAFAEFSVPLAKNFELQLAARLDKFSDYGRSTTPKVAFLWTPTRSLRVRGSYAEGFRAPSLSEIADTSVSAFQNNFFDPRRCSPQFPGNPAQPVGNLDCTNGYGFAVLIVSNTGLLPETSKSYTAGIAWEPLPNLLLTMDAYQIKRKNEVTTLATADLVDNEGSNDPRYVGTVLRAPNDPDGRPGRILSIRNRFLNQGGTTVEGIDADVSYRFSLGEHGRMTVGLQASHYLAFKLQNADGSFTDFTGVRTVPRTRASMVASWQKNAFTVSATVRHVQSQFATTNSVSPCNAVIRDYCRVPGLTTVDLNVAYTGIKDLTLRAFIGNLTQRNPPWTPQSNNGRNPLLSGSSLFGQMINIGADYRFK